MRESRTPESSHPPSDPRPAASRGGFAGFRSDERPHHPELVGTVLLGLLLLVAGLYLWRRPPSGAAGPADDGGAASAAAAAVAAPATQGSGMAEPAASAPVALSEVRVLGCHDRGPGRTSPDQCDHVVPIEQALSRAIERAATCVAAGGAADGGAAATIEYIGDFSFARQKIQVSLPRSGRSVHDRRVVLACASAVRQGLEGLTLDGMDHRHARYKISITATYRAKS